MTELRSFVPKFLLLYHLVHLVQTLAQCQERRRQWRRPELTAVSVREVLVVGMREIGRILVAAQCSYDGPSIVVIYLLKLSTNFNYYFINIYIIYHVYMKQALHF